MLVRGSPRLEGAGVLFGSACRLYLIEITQVLSVNAWMYQ